MLAFFVISFNTLDLAASFSLDLPIIGHLILDNPIAVGIVGGFVLIAVIANRRISVKHIS